MSVLCLHIVPAGGHKKKKQHCHAGLILWDALICLQTNLSHCHIICVFDQIRPNQWFCYRVKKSHHISLQSSSYWDRSETKREYSSRRHWSIENWTQQGCDELRKFLSWHWNSSLRINSSLQVHLLHCFHSRSTENQSHGYVDILDGSIKQKHFFFFF